MATKTTTAFSDANSREMAGALNRHSSKKVANWYRMYYKKRMGESSLRVKDYEVTFPVTVSWMSAVEERIRDSTASADSPDHLPGVEWLSAEAAAEAISFFRASADALPSEPHIYGTLKGDLVAEFEAEEGHFTSVVCPEMAILFGVPSRDPQNPIEATISRGSNRAREEVAEFWSKLARDRDGDLESAG